MKAIEARELTKNNILNNSELESAFSRIRGAARSGHYQTYFVDMSEPVKEELRKLGYVIHSQFSRNESNDNVTWGDLG
jgi:hypothetical protein